jgi:hypothetical protein
MRSKYEVTISIDITAFLEADTEDEAVATLSSEIENLIKGNGQQKMPSIIEIGEVDLQDSEATAL